MSGGWLRRGLASPRVGFAEGWRDAPGLGQPKRLDNLSISYIGHGLLDI